MGKSDTVQAQLSNIQAAQQSAITDALGQAYDQGVADQKASEPVGVTSGNFTQSDIDTAVAQAQGQDQQALADAQAKAQADLNALQSKLDSITQKEEGEESVIAGLSTAISNLKDSLSKVDELLPVAPQPVDQTPVVQPAEPQV